MTNFEEKDGFIWMDGEFVEWSQAKVHVLTHTLHYGLGVFEGVRAYLTDSGTKIFRLEDHTNRLFESAEAVNMSIPFSRQKLNEVQKEIFKINNLYFLFFVFLSVLLIRQGLVGLASLHFLHF